MNDEPVGPNPWMNTQQGMRQMRNLPSGTGTSLADAVAAYSDARKNWMANDTAGPYRKHKAAQQATQQQSTQDLITQQVNALFKQYVDDYSDQGSRFGDD